MNVKHQKPTSPDEIMTPHGYLKTLLSSAQYERRSSKTFSKPKEEDIAAYDLEVVMAIRTKNLERLRELYKEGKSMNACNQFGESLLHMACRRGEFDIVNFMIREAKVRVDIRDDFGRNPFHDACWTSKPNFEVMDILIDAADPVMMLTEDVRGSAPFHYARRDHYGQWLKYLNERKSTLQRKIGELPEVPI